MEAQSFIIFGLRSRGEVRLGQGKKSASSGLGEGKVEKVPIPLIGPTGLQMVDLIVRAL